MWMRGRVCGAASAHVLATGWASAASGDNISSTMLWAAGRSGAVGAITAPCGETSRILLSGIVLRI